MLTVKTPDEVFDLIKEEFPKMTAFEQIPLGEARGRVLYEAVRSSEYVPGFNRSTVDGYAVVSSDTFGCSDALPALLTVTGEVFMGEGAAVTVNPGCCVAVPTGGEVPEGADAVVMVEYIEDYGDGTIGVGKPAAPGMNMIFKGDDVAPGEVLLDAGHILSPQDIGALAALGVAYVTVCKKPVVGIISTGNELVDISEQPSMGQIRNVNSIMLKTLMEEMGADPIDYGIFKDEEELLAGALNTALAECDVVLISGGSSVGTKDATCRIIEGIGNILFHGIAIKPGKPTIFGKVCKDISTCPVIGLPGNPVAAFFVSHVFVGALLKHMMGKTGTVHTVPAVLTENIGANHGRSQYNGVFLEYKDGIRYARPIRSKSGLITSLAASDGYFVISRDCEGVAAGETIEVYVYQ